MAMNEVILPKLGEGIMEATLTRWLKKEGDYIAKNDVLAEIATDKVDSDVVSEYEGYLHDLRFQANEEVPVGGVIALISDSPERPLTGKFDAKSSDTTDTSPLTGTAMLNEGTTIKRENPSRKKIEKTAQRHIYSPLVRRMIKEHDISQDKLNAIEPTGRGGRIVKSDIELYLAGFSVENGKTSHQPPSQDAEKTAAAMKGDASSPKPLSSYNQKEQLFQKERSFYVEKDDEVQPMGKVRKLIADHMRQSIQTSAHVTMFGEADVSTLVKWKKQYAPIAHSSYQTRLTYTPLFIRAAVNALQKYSLLNSAITPTSDVVLRKNINIGLATALPDGNLIVPVIRNAINYNLLGLSKECNRLAEEARSKTLNPSEVQNGTFTITNIGTFGCLTGTPIINQPQVAILAIGAIKKRPHVVESKDGDAIAIRHILYLSLSYDHRLIDGALGGMFLNEIIEQLENFHQTTPLT